MNMLLLLQLALPLALAGWVAWRPLRSWSGAAVQITSISLYLLAIAITGLWTVLPWWTPCAPGLVLLVTLARTLRVRRRPWLPASAIEWAALGAFALLGSASVWLITVGLKGRIAPAMDTVDLDAPLEPSRYLVVNGGNHVLVNAHFKTLDVTVPRFRQWHRGRARTPARRQQPDYLIGLRMAFLKSVQPLKT